MKSKFRMTVTFFAVLFLAVLMIGCVTDGYGSPKSKAKHLLFVAHQGSLTSYDIATGEQQAGEIADVTDPNDMQALENGTLLLNLTGRNEVLVVNGKEMTPIKRIPSSLPGGTRRPSRAFLYHA